VPERPELMLKLTRALASLPGDQPLALRMCSAFVAIVEARRGSISLGFASSERTMLCATDAMAARYEDAQDVVREGPSLDAFRTGHVVTSASTEDQQARWPGLASAVAWPTDVVHAIPLRPDSTLLGVLTIHGHMGEMLDDTDQELQFLGNAVGAAIVGELPTHDDESRLWSERDRVSQATGMIIAQLGVPPGDALAVLRAHAFAHEISVVEVSGLVVDRSLDFSRPEPGAPS
jgi:hypothetical protein